MTMKIDLPKNKYSLMAQYYVAGITLSSKGSVDVTYKGEKESMSLATKSDLDNMNQEIKIDINDLVTILPKSFFPDFSGDFTRNKDYNYNLNILHITPNGINLTGKFVNVNAKGLVTKISPKLPSGSLTNLNFNLIDRTTFPKTVESFKFDEEIILHGDPKKLLGKNAVSKYYRTDWPVRYNSGLSLVAMNHPDATYARSAEKVSDGIVMPQSPAMLGPVGTISFTDGVNLSINTIGDLKSQWNTSLPNSAHGTDLSIFSYDLSGTNINKHRHTGKPWVARPPVNRDILASEFTPVELTTANLKRYDFTLLVTKDRAYALGGSSLAGGNTSREIWTSKIGAGNSLGAWTKVTLALPIDMVRSSAVLSNGYAYVISDKGVIYRTLIKEDGSLSPFQITSNATAAKPIAKDCGYAHIVGNRLWMFPKTWGDGIQSPGDIYFCDFDIRGELGAQHRLVDVFGKSVNIKRSTKNKFTTGAYLGGGMLTMFGGRPNYPTNRMSPIPFNFRDTGSLSFNTNIGDTDVPTYPLISETFIIPPETNHPYLCATNDRVSFLVYNDVRDNNKGMSIACSRVGVTNSDHMALPIFEGGGSDDPGYSFNYDDIKYLGDKTVKRAGASIGYIGDRLYVIGGYSIEKGPTATGLVNTFYLSTPKPTVGAPTADYVTVTSLDNATSFAYPNAKGTIGMPTIPSNYIDGAVQDYRIKLTHIDIDKIYD